MIMWFVIGLIMRKFGTISTEIRQNGWMIAIIQNNSRGGSWPSLNFSVPDDAAYRKERLREGQDPPLHFMYRYRAVSRRTFISLSVRCALSAGTVGGGSRPLLRENWRVVAIKTGHLKILCLRQGQMYTLERFSVLHENNLFFCIIVLDKSLKGW